MIYVNPATLAKLTRLAEDRGVRRGLLLRDIVEAYLAEHAAEIPAEAPDPRQVTLADILGEDPAPALDLG